MATRTDMETIEVGDLFPLTTPNNREQICLRVFFMISIPFVNRELKLTERLVIPSVGIEMTRRRPSAVVRFSNIRSIHGNPATSFSWQIFPTTYQSKRCQFTATNINTESQIL